MGHLLPKITGQVIGHFNAYKGSRAAYSSDKILIVRGMSADNIKLEEMADKIDELENILQAEEIKIDSDAGKNFIEKVDTDKNYILVKGNVPGPKKGLVMVKTTTKKVKHVDAKELLVRTVAETKAEEVVEETEAKEAE